MPTRISARVPPGASPGTIQRAIRPTIRPKMIQARIPNVFPSFALRQAAYRERTPLWWTYPDYEAYIHLPALRFCRGSGRRARRGVDRYGDNGFRNRQRFIAAQYRYGLRVRRNLRR